MRKIIFFISFLISTNVYADVIRLTCNCDTRFTMHYWDQNRDNRLHFKDEMLLTRSLSINLKKSKIKSTIRSSDATEKEDFRIIDVRKVWENAKNTEVRITAYKVPFSNIYTTIIINMKDLTMVHLSQIDEGIATYFPFNCFRSD